MKLPQGKLYISYDETSLLYKITMVKEIVTKIYSFELQPPENYLIRTDRLESIEAYFEFINDQLNPYCIHSNSYNCSLEKIIEELDSLLPAEKNIYICESTPYIKLPYNLKKKSKFSKISGIKQKQTKII